MDLTTYSGLQSAIADWLDRTDMTARIPSFIQLGEARLNRILRTLNQIEIEDITVDSEYKVLPATWAQTSNLCFTSAPVDEITYLAPDSFVRARMENPANGKPKFYTIRKGRIYFLPAPDSDQYLTHSYYEKIPALSDSNTSNWLLDAHPDLYLNTAIFQAYRLLRDDEGMAEAQAQIDQALAEIDLMTSRATTPTTPKVRTKPI